MGKKRRTWYLIVNNVVSIKKGKKNIRGRNKKKSVNTGHRIASCGPSQGGCLPKERKKPGRAGCRRTLAKERCISGLSENQEKHPSPFKGGKDLTILTVWGGSNFNSRAGKPEWPVT